MALQHFKYLIFGSLTSCFFTVADAQVGLCPPNMDFEAGDFTNWVCQTGFVSVVNGINTVNLSVSGPIPGRHTIISSATAGTDPFGGFPQLCPNGSQYSVMLGNSSGGHEAESISYTCTIPNNLTVFSILFHYAVVLQNPNHTPEQQPRFRARIVDLSTNLPIPCVTFDFTASSGLPGFVQSPADPSVLYKDWTPVSINLSAYIGRTIMLEFITSDCTFQAHFGYAYVDVNTACNGVIAGTFICPGDNDVTLTAPFGFQSYEWYSDNTFTTILSNSQTLHLNPPPPVGSIFPVIVTPYPSFGCKDTLYATMGVGTRPVSNAGPDFTICQGQLPQIGAPSTPGYSYLWSPPGLLNNPNISNPTLLAIGPFPTQFIVKTTDILSGCTSFDTTIVSAEQVDTAIRVTGKTDFCPGDPFIGSLSASAAVTGVQWYDANGPIPGATLHNYQPAGNGTFWAQVTENGCTDSTASVVFSTHPLPQASFTLNSDSSCITNNSFVFTNTSTIGDGSPMSYNWKFSDGTFQTTTDAMKTFLSPGSYTTELVTTVIAAGCKDSTRKVVYVLPNGIARFTWDSVCTSRPVQFHNLSNENGSVQVNYNWDFNNGGPGSLLKDPLPVVYSTPGSINVTLKMIALGCEADSQVMIKTVLVNKQDPGIHYRDITVPEGGGQFIHVQNIPGGNYQWRPQSQLSNYFNQYTEFFAVDDVKYLIDISDIHTCVTTDTLQMLVLKKPGYYLPTAFTPNGDGLNDIVRPYLVGMKSLGSFSIFNRWGNLVFYSKTEGEGWDGRYKGIAQDPGVYVWILEYTDTNNKKITAKGTITLIR